MNPANANSGWLVLPTTTAPAARSLRGTRPSWVAGGASANTTEPNVDGMPGNVFHVLHQERQPCERTDVLAVHESRIDVASIVERLLPKADHGIERRI